MQPRLGPDRPDLTAGPDRSSEWLGSHGLVLFHVKPRAKLRRRSQAGFHPAAALPHVQSRRCTLEFRDASASQVVTPRRHARRHRAARRMQAAVLKVPAQMDGWGRWS
jgi:hypothetical protein